MINFEPHEISKIISNALKYEKDSKINIIEIDSFLDALLAREEKDPTNMISYPMTINVARPIDYMLETGDYSPLKVVTIDKPILYNGRKIWTKDSKKGILIPFGFENGDKNLISEISFGNLSSISAPHLHLSGTTGSGKSVTLDVIILCMCILYSPYHINLHLVDPKKTGAGNFAVGSQIPHIKSIGISEDSGFMDSLVKSITKKSKDVYNLCAATGTKDIQAFCEKYNLVIARDVFIADEYQYLLNKVEAKIKESILGEMDTLGRTSRASGQHMLLATQEYDSSVKSKVLGNVALRASLMCDESVSTELLGNRLASNCVTPGELYFNMKSDQSENATKMFKVPFSHEVKKTPLIKDFLSEAGEIYGYQKTLNFFSDSSSLKIEELDELINKYGQPNRLVLGQPGYVKDIETDVCYYDYKFLSNDNTVVYSPNPKTLSDLFKIVDLNFSRTDLSKINLKYFMIDKAFSSNVDIKTDTEPVDMRRPDDPDFVVSLLKIKIKDFLLETDKRIFKGTKCTIEEELLKKCKAIRLRGKLFSVDLDNELIQKRIQLCYEKAKNEKNMYGFMGDKVRRMDELNFCAIMLPILNELIIEDNTILSRRITDEDFKPTFLVLGGIEMLDKICANQDYNCYDSFKTYINSAYLTRTCFIVFSRTLNNCGDLVKNSTRFITSGLPKEDAKSPTACPKDTSEKIANFTLIDENLSLTFKRLETK